MLNRRTAIIFTDADRANSAGAVRQQLSELLPGGAVIVIDNAELYADAFKDFLEKVFGIPANIEKRLAALRKRRIKSLVFVTPESVNCFKSTDAYKRMENILNRYTLAARKKFLSAKKFRFCRTKTPAKAEKCSIRTVLPPVF